MMMKKTILLAIAMISLVACSGDRGPQGPPGPTGDALIGTTLDFSVNFPLENEVYYNFFDNGIEVFESDAVLVYRSEEVLSDPSGPIDVWKQLPQTIYLNDGSELVYNFDYTFEDVRLFIEGTANFDALDPNVYYNDQYFRIVVVPSDFANDPTNNLETYQGLQQSLQQQNLALRAIDVSL